eukprot:3443998-Ditylum_brightwellii.AAC.1
MMYNNDDYAYSTGEEDSDDDLSEDEESTQQDNIDDTDKIIHELAHHMEVAEQKLNKSKKQVITNKPEEKDLMKSILEKTAQLEAMAGKPTSEEIVKLMANTNQLVDKQAKYKKWKENHINELKAKFNKQHHQRPTTYSQCSSILC